MPSPLLSSLDFNQRANLLYATGSDLPGDWGVNAHPLCLLMHHC